MLFAHIIELFSGDVLDAYRKRYLFVQESIPEVLVIIYYRQNDKAIYLYRMILNILCYS